MLVFGAALLVLVACSHVQPPATAPFVTLGYEPAWLDKPWTLVVTSDGAVIETVTGRIGPDRRSLRPLSAEELSLLRQLARELAGSSSPARLAGGSEDEVTFWVALGGDRPSEHRLHGPDHLACNSAAAPILAVWNALVSARTPRPGCPEVLTCIATCGGGSPNPSLQRTTQARSRLCCR